MSGKSVKLRATAYGTDCCPRREIETHISLKTINQAYLFNPRNMYQNYGVATPPGKMRGMRHLPGRLSVRGIVPRTYLDDVDLISNKSNDLNRCLWPISGSDK